MIDSQIGWLLFNELMNSLRTSIFSYGWIFLVSGSKFILSNSIPLSGEQDSKIIGIYRENNEVSVIVQDSEGEENDFDLTYPGFHPDDFLNLLENLENENNI